MEILFVTSELAPYSRHGAVADIAAALPKALRSLGHRTTVVSPLYENIDITARSLARRLSTLQVQLSGKQYTCTVYDGRTTAGVDVVFLDNAELFRSRKAGQGDSETQLLAALLLGGAAAQLAQKREPAVDVVHAFDAGAAAALAYAKTALPSAARVLSLCDVRDPGKLTPSMVDSLGLPNDVLGQLPAHDPSLLGLGIHAADSVVADSVSTAHALLDDATSPLANLLREKGARTLGIVNGVDASIWNPLTDSTLPARFDAVDTAGKARCKAALQYQLGLSVEHNVPLLVTGSDLDVAHCGDLIAKIAEPLTRAHVQLAVIGNAGVAQDALHTLAQAHPTQVALHPSPSDKDHHLAIAGADFLLLPSRSTHGLEPVLCALRYGTLPIARPVGVLTDALIDADAQLQTGNAFLCLGDDDHELLATARRALGAYGNHHAFEAFRRRVMKTDVSWDRAARRYEHTYRQLRAATQTAA